MNKRLALVMGFFLLTTMAHADEGESVRVNVPVKHVYVPQGFDDNDNTEIVITGYLPNLCYYGPSGVATVNEGTIKVAVTAYKQKPSLTSACAQMIVPFTLTVNLGVISKGQYSIVVNGGVTPQSFATLTIVRSFESSVDNYIYANVDSVSRIQGTRIIKLHGYNPSDCYTLDRVEKLSNGVDTYTVLPIMKKLRDHCPMKMIPFEMSVEVPQTLDGDELLVHTRAMRGASVNYLFMEK